jgi:hypothetical protein
MCQRRKLGGSAGELFSYDVSSQKFVTEEWTHV